MNKRGCNSCVCLALLFVLSIAGPELVSAQGTTAPPQEATSVTDPAQQSATPATSSSSSTPNEVPPIPLTSERSLEDSGVRDLGGNGNWFSNNFDWFHWGPVGITSAELLYIYSQQDTGQGNPNLSAGIFETNIAFSRRLRHSWLVLQYNPRLLYLDGHFGMSLTNQDSTIDLLFAPTQRLTVGISNSVSFYGSNNLLNDRTLSINQFSGSLTNPFLNNGNNTIVDSAGIPVSYKLSSQTTLSASPFFDYLDTYPGAHQVSSTAVPPLDETLFAYGINTQVNHVFSQSQSAGIFYWYQVNPANRLGPETHFHSFGVSATHRFGRSLLATLQLGSSYANNQVGGWNGVGSFTLTKSFRRGALEGTFSRDASFSGLIGTQYTDKAWVNYSYTLGRKTDFAAGGGYLHGSGQGSTTGKYVDGRIDYKLTPKISWFFAYTRYMQSGNSLQLLIGNESQFQSGLRWAPRRKAAL